MHPPPIYPLPRVEGIFLRAEKKILTLKGVKRCKNLKYENSDFYPRQSVSLCRLSRQAPWYFPQPALFNCNFRVSIKASGQTGYPETQFHLCGGRLFLAAKSHSPAIQIFTSNLRLAEAPGNVLIPASETGLPKDSVANVSQVITVDRAFLTEKCGNVPSPLVRTVDEGLRLALSL